MPTCSLRLEPPLMTRCECAGISFEEVAARMRDGQLLAEITHRTGCGQTCTACLPDLQAFLASRR